MREVAGVDSKWQQFKNKEKIYFSRFKLSKFQLGHLSNDITFDLKVFSKVKHRSSKKYLGKNIAQDTTAGWLYLD